MRRRRSKAKLAAAFAVLLGFSMGVARAAPPNAAPAAAPRVEKTSPAYRDGYADGCAHATTGDQRNETQFRTNTSYHGGWMAGFQSCYSHMTINTNGDPNGPFKNPF